jgi:hypothetical protein
MGDSADSSSHKPASRLARRSAAARRLNLSRKLSSYRYSYNNRVDCATEFPFAEWIWCSRSLKKPDRSPVRTPINNRKRTASSGCRRDIPPIAMRKWDLQLAFGGERVL